MARKLHHLKILRGRVTVAEGDIDVDPGQVHDLEAAASTVLASARRPGGTSGLTVQVWASGGRRYIKEVTLR